MQVCSDVMLEQVTGDSATSFDRNDESTGEKTTKMGALFEVWFETKYAAEWKCQRK